MMGGVYEGVFSSSDRAVGGPICRLLDRAVGVHQTEKVEAAGLEDCYASHSRGYSNHLSPGWACAL